MRPQYSFLLNKFSIVYISRLNIMNRQNPVNMKAIIGAVVMTHSALILFLYRDPGKAYIVVLNGRTWSCV